MEAIRFKVSGIFNSFRIPFFRTYQKTFLAPTKTNIIGLLTNIMGSSEKTFYEILNKEVIDVSVVIDNIAGRAKDMWAYKTLENKGGMHGRSVIRRDRLFKACYTIYLSVKDTLLEEKILDSLKYPKNIPSLGLDDEIVVISDVEKINLKHNESNIIDSIFVDKGYKYKAVIKDVSKQVELPTSNIAPMNYSISISENQRFSRTAQNEMKQIEFINCEMHFEKIESYTDDINRVVFY